MLCVSSSNLSDAGVRSMGSLRKNMRTQITEHSILIPITPPSLSPLKWGMSAGEIQPLWWKITLLPESFPTLLKLLKPKWRLFKHLTANIEVKVVGVQRWLTFQVEQAPQKIYLKLSLIKILVWGRRGDLCIQNNLYCLYLKSFKIMPLSLWGVSEPLDYRQLDLVGICLYHSAQGIWDLLLHRQGDVF